MPTVSLRARDLSWVADELDPKYAKIFERVLSDKDIQEIVQTFEKTGNLADTSKKTGSVGRQTEAAGDYSLGRPCVGLFRSYSLQPCQC